MAEEAQNSSMKLCSLMDSDITTTSTALKTGCIFIPKILPGIFSPFPISFLHLQGGDLLCSGLTTSCLAQGLGANEAFVTMSNTP